MPIHTWDVEPNLPLPGGGGGALYLYGEESIDRAPVPDQALVSATQVNFLTNNDTLLMVSGTNVTALHNPDVLAHFQQLWSQAQSDVPSWLPHERGHGADASTPSRRMMPRSTGAISDPDAATLHPGVTIDGVLQPDGTALVVPDPALPDLTFGSHNGMLNPGTDAQTGGNLSLNYATIVDAHHMTTQPGGARGRLHRQCDRPDQRSREFRPDRGCWPDRSS